ncbi:alkyl sulfatase BDS1-like metallo-beta-lactamase superfamily hydrolase [Antricoccus suffuscus]|uniref:Linear primary-alkylsulfatase n=1 Tax=Antricoccus suffuscus TaxID=1629062 RepID=A0A2T1A6T3_9ACTN|nr:alkyl sulfatase dimerization domain-containing protein [Antricoccus suffuscus]PRZ44306.1 alkyl sulfatase BDS1-like metallo-beta-lactamase superfamily hydrolase [Antricoccus suffuscus]
MTTDNKVSANSSPRPASDATRAANSQAVQSLPFGDRQAFEDSQRGRIASIEPPTIAGASGRPVWDLEQYAFIGAEAPDSVHPSLWRMAQLNQAHGLFTVADRIHQVRGYDISNMTIIEGATGYIVIDPLTTAETAAAGMQLVHEHLGERPITAIIYTHSHVDHFGGVRGIVEESDLVARGVPIVAPTGFMDEAISENVYAGNAMLRRAMYMFGPLLPRGPLGQVTTGLGVTTPGGTNTLIAPTHSINTTGSELTLDGLRFVFQYTPDSEAPAEMTFHIPELRALCMAENVSHVMHNLYTLRGAQVRDARSWSGYLNEAIELFIDETDVMFISHHWPVWGQDAVREFIGKQRDLYKFMHDETLRLANHGYTMVEIAEMIQMPAPLASFWANRGLYGSLNHNVKAVYQRYLGFFDANPANLNPLPPREMGERYVAALGGASAVIDKATAAFAEADYRWGAELLKHVLSAEPDNDDAKRLQAETFEQLGYQAESGPWRNFYLTGAHELRNGVLQVSGKRRAGGTEIPLAMTTEMLLDFMGIRLNSPKAGDTVLHLNLVTTEPSERYLVTVQNGVLFHTRDKQSPDADATITTTRQGFGAIVRGAATLDDAVADGSIDIAGDRGAFEKLLSLLDNFSPSFNIVTPN